MNRWKAVIALALAVLYLPATGHCLLEQAGLLNPAGDCCEQNASGDTSQTAPCPSGCCPIEYAVYLSPNHGVATSLITVVPACGIFVVLDSTVNEPQLASPNPSPPILPQSWQFSFRTALPPRAPSFVS